MSFLFRKYQPTEADSPEDEAADGEPEVKHEVPFTLFPPSPKAQIYLIFGAVVLLNIVLLAIVAVGIWINLR